MNSIPLTKRLWKGVLLGCVAFTLIQFAARSLPDVKDTPIASKRAPAMVAACLNDLNHGELRSLGSGEFEVKVRGGRRRILTTFIVAAAGAGSTITQVHSRDLLSGWFVSTKGCL